MSTDAPEHGALTRRLPERIYRPELHGVRGLAILGVVLFHLFGAGRISGGIDIFLAISGFLFTAMLLREAASSGGSVRIFRYLARLARRLLPPAALVIVATVAAGLIFMPSTRHEQLWSEARASLLYFENVELITSQLGYGAAGPESSPFQHFWSLSVQGQFYLVWPVVAIAAVLIAKRLKRSAMSVMTVLVILLLVISFAFTLYMQGYDQDQAYLMTRTRFWELAFGALLALGGASLTLPKSLRLPAGWLGVLLIVTCGLLLDGAQLFPGPWALWPLAGLALVLASVDPHDQESSHRASAARFLSHSGFTWIGNIAYGLYLWHWPLLIFYLEIRDREAVGIRGAAAVFAVSLLAAWLMYRWVERPVAQVRWTEKLQLAATVTFLGAAGVTATLALQHAVPEVPEGFALSGVDRDDHPGADALADDPAEVPQGIDPLPDPEILAQDQAMYYDWGCQQTHKDEPGAGEVLVCEDPERPQNPEATIMIAGGSHAGHWYNAWALMAQQNNWELLVADKSGCRFRHTENLETDRCSQWNAEFHEVVEEREPDLVVTTGTAAYRSGSTESVSDGAEDRWDEILEAGSELLLIRGTARPDEDVPDCLADGGSPSDCGADFGVYAPTNPLEEMDLSEGIHTLDMTPWVCPDGTCPAVIGNVAVYNDDSHLSNYYVESLAPYLEEELRREMPHLYD